MIFLTILIKAIEAYQPTYISLFCKKNNCLGCEPKKKKLILVKKIIFVAWGGRFCDLLSFPKNKDRSPKIRITCIQSLFLFQSCDQDIERVLPKIRIDH